MSLTYWLLSGLLVIAALLCLWAWLTGRPARQRAPRQGGTHNAQAREAVTRRLKPPPVPGWIPPAERPGGEAPPPDWPPRRPE